MGIVSVVLLVFFVIVAILLILLVLVQSGEGDGLGGIFAGGSSSAFGSRSGNVLTRATTVMGVLFLVISLGLALLNRTPGGSGVETAGRELSIESASGNWLEDELNPRVEIVPEVIPGLEFIPETEVIPGVEFILESESPEDALVETGAAE